MTDPIGQYLLLTDDKYTPAISKQVLNTRDPYQIYSLYSTTVKSTKFTASGSEQLVETDKDIIAVQRYHPIKPLFDFDAIARQYP